MSRNIQFRLYDNPYFIALLLFSLCFLYLWAPNAFADLQAFKECVINKLIEILEIGVITLLVSIIVEHGLSELAKRAGVELLKKLAKAVGKKLVPWLGAILIIIELLLLIKDCVPLL